MYQHQTTTRFLIQGGRKKKIFKKKKKWPHMRHFLFNRARLNTLYSSTLLAPSGSPKFNKVPHCTAAQTTVK